LHISARCAGFALAFGLGQLLFSPAACSPGQCFADAHLPFAFAGGGVLKAFQYQQ